MRESDTQEPIGREMAESVVFPDLNNIELQNKYHVVGKEALLLELLTAGEYEKLKNVVEEVQ